MEYRRLGSSGLKVSSLCLGAMTFGQADEQSFMHNASADEETSFAIMDRARELGINFIDTADVYGQDGLSERVTGRWIKERNARNDVILATKMRFRMWDGPNGSGSSRYRILRCVEDSLRRMQTDRIDLLQLHMQDTDVEEEETMRALDDVVRQGKVLYLGCSNYTAYRLTESLFVSKAQHLERFVALQAQYSLVVRDLEREHVPLCERHGVGLLPWSPLAGGLLSCKYERGTNAPEGTRFSTPRWKTNYARFDNDRAWRIVDALKKVATERGASPSSVALAWLLGRRTVSSVIFGARTVAQIEDNAKAMDVKLSDAEIAALDEASSFELGYPYDFIQRIQNRW